MGSRLRLRLQSRFSWALGSQLQRLGLSCLSFFPGRLRYFPLFFLSRLSRYLLPTLCGWVLLFQVRPYYYLPSLLLSRRGVIRSSRMQCGRLRLRGASRLPRTSSPSGVFSGGCYGRGRASRRCLCGRRFRGRGMRPRRTTCLHCLPLSRTLFLPSLYDQSCHPYDVRGGCRSITETSYTSTRGCILRSPSSLPRSCNLAVKGLSKALPSSGLLRRFLPCRTPLCGIIRRRIHSRSSDIGLCVRIFLARRSSPRWVYRGLHPSSYRRSRLLRGEPRLPVPTRQRETRLPC